MSKLQKNALEWAVFGVGLALVLATLGFLVYEAASSPDTPPDLTVELGAPERRGQGWAVPVTVRNRGEETAEGVRVEVVLQLPGGREERSEVEMMFVPRRSQREGWVYFVQDPARGRLRGRVSGFEKP
jgi:uncharacterized protein (TIGR02588 family)